VRVAQNGDGVALAHGGAETRLAQLDIACDVWHRWRGAAAKRLRENYCWRRLAPPFKR